VRWRAGALLGVAFGAAASAPADLGFTGGLAPMVVGDAPSPESCGGCHEQEHADWAASRHRAAWSNAILQAGYVAEPRPFCVHCHAPLEAQVAEVLRNQAWYVAQDPRSGRVAPGAKRPEPLAAEGVSCAACHWRDGEVLAAEATAGAPHDIRVEPRMQDSVFCKDCHEFAMPAWDGGAMVLTDTPMQSTWSEWDDWRRAGGDQTCQGCHMPGGRHTFHGAHDRELLRGSVRVEAAPGVLRLRSVGVGHHLPSGDLFRRLTIEVESRGAWEIVATIGRRYEVVERDGRIRKVLSEDTALRPGEAREIPVPRSGRWRVVYHYGAEHDEGRGLVSLDELLFVLAEGALP
jgi:hypothetical protein